MRMQLVDPFICGRLRMKMEMRLPTRPRRPTQFNRTPGKKNWKTKSMSSSSVWLWQVTFGPPPPPAQPLVVPFVATEAAADTFPAKAEVIAVGGNDCSEPGPDRRQSVVFDIVVVAQEDFAREFCIGGETDSILIYVQQIRFGCRKTLKAYLAYLSQAVTATNLY